MRRVAFMKAGPSELVSSYLHGEGAIGVLVRLAANDRTAFNDGRVLAFAHDLALHVAAFRPVFLDEARVPPSYIEERLALVRKEVEEDRAARTKPESIREGIVAGRLRKHLSGICLLGHGFVKDEKSSVAKVLAGLMAETGFKVSVEGFAGFGVGEA